MVTFKKPFCYTEMLGQGRYGMHPKPFIRELNRTLECSSLVHYFAYYLELKYALWDVSCHLPASPLSVTASNKQNRFSSKN